MNYGTSNVWNFILLWSALITTCILICGCGTISQRGTNRDVSREGTYNPNEITIPIGSHDPDFMRIERELFFLLNGE